MRIPIHEIAGMSYIRDDDEHILAIKKGISILFTSPSVSVASRRITPSQRPLRDLCSLMFGATRLKETTKNIIFEISMLDYPIWSLESSLSDYF